MQSEVVSLLGAALVFASIVIAPMLAAYISYKTKGWALPHALAFGWVLLSPVAIALVLVYPMEHNDAAAFGTGFILLPIFLPLLLSWEATSLHRSVCSSFV